MRQLDKPEQARAYLEDSRVGLLRMSNILKELLVFSRSHRMPAAVAGLTEVIHQALAPYEQRARECRTQIRLDVPPDLPPCPSHELWEVIGNVVKNALDAMGENGVLTIRAVEEDSRVTITISDTGPGVPEELREKIFEPFFTTKHDRPRHRPRPGALPRLPPPDRRRDHPRPVRARRRVPTGLSDQTRTGELKSMPNDSASLLVVDDDPLVLKSLCEYLRVEGYRVSPAQSLQEGMALLEKDRFHVALTDVRLPEGSGFDFLQHLKTLNLSTAVIMLTGYGSIEDAVRAIKMGAFDYVTKPISDEEVKLSVERALQQQSLLEENRHLRQQLNMSYHLDNMVCRDPAMQRTLEMIRVVAGTDTTVLITGESGTGKTLAARAIHAHSQRAGFPFVEVGCGTLPDTLLESELFGHAKGSFSGAIANKRGKFEAADKGTIFLDEISIASPSLQMKLLRVLESFKFEPVGSNVTQEVNVRLILASNRDLADLVREGKFREDLYYRVNVMNVCLPPLRERREDIAPLANHFIQKYRHEAIHPVEGISDEAMRILAEFNWPGNVRELENVIRRAVVLCRASIVTPADLPPKMASLAGPAMPPDGKHPAAESRDEEPGAPADPGRAESRRREPQGSGKATEDQPHHALQQDA